MVRGERVQRFSLSLRIPQSRDPYLYIHGCRCTSLRLPSTELAAQYGTFHFSWRERRGEWLNAKLPILFCLVRVLLTYYPRVEQKEEKILYLPTMSTGVDSE